MKNIRNVLVHRYGGVNDSEVYNIIKKKLGIFKEFRGEVIVFLRRGEGKGKKRKGL